MADDQLKSEMLNTNKTKDCAVCSNRSGQGQRKRTKLYCSSCPNNPGLHPGDCFKKYHSLKNYKM